MVQAKTTNKLLKDVLSDYLSKIEVVNNAVLDFWPTLLPSHIASQTRATRFSQKVLLVTVFNSSLYSLLSQYEKPHLLAKLQQRFGSEQIQQLFFRIG